MKPVCLTIASTDPVGGAGVSLDLQVFKSLNTRGYSVVSMVVAQNSSSVSSFEAVSNQLFYDQLTAVFSVASPSAIKLGLLHRDHLQVLMHMLKKGQISASVVLDPVLGSSSGYRFTDSEALVGFFPYCSLLTPNIPEAEILAGQKICSIGDIHSAGNILLEKSKGAPVIIKGGHFSEPCSDYLFISDTVHEIETRFIDSPYAVRGTGCLFSSAIASYLAHGMALQEAISNAKRYLERQLGEIEIIDDRTAMFKVLA